MPRIPLNDGSYSHLIDGARLVGSCDIPVLMDLKNTQIPKDLIAFNKAKRAITRRRYVHFYEHDKFILKILRDTERYVELFKTYDGVITPDFSLLRGAPICTQQINTYYNRAVGFYLQKKGIPVIPNIRWGDRRSFDFCFLGVPKKSIVAVSTHGCIRSEESKKYFREGIEKLIDVLEPTDILVHGHMPDAVFSPFKADVQFHRYPSQFEQTHEGDK